MLPRRVRQYNRKRKETRKAATPCVEQGRLGYAGLALSGHTMCWSRASRLYGSRSGPPSGDSTDARALCHESFFAIKEVEARDDVCGDLWVIPGIDGIAATLVMPRVREVSCRAKTCTESLTAHWAAVIRSDEKPPMASLPVFGAGMAPKSAYRREGSIAG